MVVIVSTGNGQPRGGEFLEEAVTGYPDYLLEAGNRFFEPAGAMSIISVGSIAHGEGFDASFGQEARVRSITKQSQPSPFSRVGPGIGGATKPDVVDVGGTIIFDPTIGRLRGGEDLPSAGVLCLHHLFLERLPTGGVRHLVCRTTRCVQRRPNLFKVSRCVGKSYPRFADRLGKIPQPTIECMSLLDGEALRAVSGHGRIDLERAAFSDDARVVLYAKTSCQSTISASIGSPFRNPSRRNRGNAASVSRWLTPCAAIAPRTDYAGVGMSFEWSGDVRRN